MDLDAPPPLQKRWRWADLLSIGLPAASLALALLLPTFPLWTGQAQPRWDAQTFYFPAFSLVADAARHGELVLWNLWLSGGRPELADPQVGALSPVVLAAGWLLGGSLGGFVAYWLAIWWATSFGTYVLARSLGAPRWGALLVAAGMLASGFVVGHAQHTSFLATFAYLPWILWRLDCFLRRGQQLAAAQIGMLLGLSSLGGYPALVFVQAGLAAIWAAGRCFWGWEEVLAIETPTCRRPGAWKTLVAGGLLAAGVALAVMAPTYVAYLTEGRDFSDRVTALPRERAVGEGGMHPASLATLVAPELAVPRIYRQQLWGLSGFHLAGIYLGIPSLLLAALALWGFPRSAFRWLLLVVVLLALGLALGPLLPLRGWLYDWVPPTRYSRHPMLFRSAALMALACLAALATRDFARDPTTWLRRLARLGWVLTPLAGLLLFGVRRSDPVLWHALPKAQAIAATLLCLAPGILAWWGLRSRRLALVPTLLAALALLEASSAIWRCRELVYFDHRRSLFPELAAGRAHRDPTQFLDQTARGLARRKSSSFRGVNNWDAMIGSAQLINIEPFSSQLGQFAKSPVLLNAVLGPSRIWFSRQAALEEDDAAALQRLAARVDQIGAPVLVVHPPREGIPPPSKGFVPLDQLPPMERVEVDLLEYRPTRLRFAVTAPEDGWLWVTDRATAGWRVALDGVPGPWWRAMHLFRAVEITKGRHEVAFEYHPTGYPGLLILSWSVVGGVLVATLYRWRAPISSKKPGAQPEATPAN